MGIPLNCHRNAFGDQYSRQHVPQAHSHRRAHSGAHGHLPQALGSGPCGDCRERARSHPADTIHHNLHLTAVPRTGSTPRGKVFAVVDERGVAVATDVTQGPQRDFLGWKCGRRLVDDPHRRTAGKFFQAGLHHAPASK